MRSVSGTMVTDVAGESIGSMFWNLVRNAKAGEQVYRLVDILM